MPMYFKNQTKPVLYHAISSYQLLEAVLHRQKYHNGCPAILILPDFIVQKYPHVKRLVTKGFFDKVCLFEYLKISHTNKAEVLSRVLECIGRILPFSLYDFKEIYVLGAHFYFTLGLIHLKIPFTFFEDAAGFYSKGHLLYENLLKSYPVHAQIAKSEGLFCGQNPLIKQIVLLKRAQTCDVSSTKFVDFDLQNELLELDAKILKRVISLFVKRRIKARGDAILLTQNFYGQKLLSKSAQVSLYKSLAYGPLSNKKLVIKPHPDDFIDYGSVFDGAKIIKKRFPAELLPYILKDYPKTLYTFDSSSYLCLTRHFDIIKLKGGAGIGPK